MWFIPLVRVSCICTKFCASTYTIFKKAKRTNTTWSLKSNFIGPFSKFTRIPLVTSHTCGPKNIDQFFFIILALWMLFVCLIELISMWQNCIFVCKRFISWNAHPPFLKIPVIPSGYPLGLTRKENLIKIWSRSLHAVKSSKACFIDSGLGLAPPHTGPYFEGVNQCMGGYQKTWELDRFQAGSQFETLRVSHWAMLFMKSGRKVLFNVRTGPLKLGSNVYLYFIETLIGYYKKFKAKVSSFRIN
jgi:hypothetical protein